MGTGLDVCVKEQLKCRDLFDGMDDRPVESLLVRVKGKGFKGSIKVCICYRSGWERGQATERSVWVADGNVHARGAAQQDTSNQKSLEGVRNKLLEQLSDGPTRCQV